MFRVPPVNKFQISFVNDTKLGLQLQEGRKQVCVQLGMSICLLAYNTNRARLILVFGVEFGETVQKCIQQYQLNYVSSPSANLSLKPKGW